MYKDLDNYGESGERATECRAVKEVTKEAKSAEPAEPKPIDANSDTIRIKPASSNNESSHADESAEQTTDHPSTSATGTETVMQEKNDVTS